VLGQGRADKAAAACIDGRGRTSPPGADIRKNQNSLSGTLPALEQRYTRSARLCPRVRVQDGCLEAPQYTPASHRKASGARSVALAQSDGLRR